MYHLNALWLYNWSWLKLNWSVQLMCQKHILIQLNYRDRKLLSPIKMTVISALNHFFFVKFACISQLNKSACTHCHGNKTSVRFRGQRRQRIPCNRKRSLEWNMETTTLKLGWLKIDRANLTETLLYQIFNRPGFLLLLFFSFTFSFNNLTYMRQYRSKIYEVDVLILSILICYLIR